MLILERILSVLAPHDCIGCNAEGSLLCLWCRGNIVPTPPRCYRCKKFNTDSSTCSQCRKLTRLGYVWVVTEYEGMAKQLVRKLKYSSAKEAASVIAECMSNALPELHNEWVVVPIPTASQRVRQRGYDQSVVIAKDLARLQQLGCCLALRRKGQTRQVGSKREVRKLQMQDSFVVTKQRDIANKAVLLVDDISTTGATIEAAASVLCKAGASKVYAIVFCQRS